jgi:hypothetical protein
MHTAQACPSTIVRWPIHPFACVRLQLLAGNAQLGGDQAMTPALALSNNISAFRNRHAIGILWTRLRSIQIQLASKHGPTDRGGNQFLLYFLVRIWASNPRFCSMLMMGEEQIRCRYTRVVLTHMSAWHESKSHTRDTQIQKECSLVISKKLDRRNFPLYPCS